MPTKPIERLMFAQGGLCFFCNEVLPKAEASVEHLVPSARAGSNSDDNCVVCCKAMNNLLGCMSLKEKIRVVLNQNGKFACPGNVGKKVATVAPTVVVKKVAAVPAKQVVQKTQGDFYAIVLSDLRKRGPSRPRKVETLKNTIKATVKSVKGALNEAQLEALYKQLLANGKVKVEGTKVSYTL